MKHRLKARYYIRYCDDFVLLHEAKAQLLSWKEEIKVFLKARLRLALNACRQTVGRISNGIDFLGYIVRPAYLLARRRVVNRLKASLVEWQRLLVREQQDCIVFNYNPEALEQLMATWASYMAHLKMANKYMLRKKLLERFSWLEHFFHHKEGTLTLIHEAPGTLNRLKGQYRFFLGRCRGSILFFQIGRFYEFYDRQAEIAQELLGLKETETTRGFRTRCGFPVRLKEMYLRGLLRSGVSVYVIREQGRWLSGLKKRSIAEEWIPLPLAANG